MSESFYSIAPTNIIRLGDVRFWNSIIYEQEKAFCPIVSYKQLLTKPNEVDDIHGELPNTWKRFGEAIQVRGYLKPSDEEHPNSKWGIEETRNVSLFCSVPSLVASGLAIQDQETFLITLKCGRGDRFFFGSPVVYEYDVLEFRRGATYINTDVPIYYECRAERFRPEATGYSGLQPSIDTSLQGKSFP
jgi:hypothetical protein